MNPSQLFDKSFQYYLNNKDQLISEFRGKAIVIFDGKVISAYASKLEAYIKAPKEHNLLLGSFVIKECEDDRSDKSVRVYHSRLSFK